MTKIKFRRCEIADLEQAVPLIYSAGPVAFDIAFSDSHPEQSKAFLAATYAKPGSEFSYDQHFAMIRNGELIGLGGIKTAQQTFGFSLKAAVAIFNFYPLFGAIRTIMRGLKVETVLKPPKKRIAMIHNLAVSPNFQGEGLGTQLIAYLEQQMLAMGFTTAALDVDGNNPRAKALYQKLGYQAVEDRAGLVTGRFTKPMTMQSCYMEKSLIN